MVTSPSSVKLRILIITRYRACQTQSKLEYPISPDSNVLPYFLQLEATKSSFKWLSYISKRAFWTHSVQWLACSSRNKALGPIGVHGFETSAVWAIVCAGFSLYKKNNLDNFPMKISPWRYPPPPPYRNMLNMVKTCQCLTKYHSKYVLVKKWILINMLPKINKI